MVAFHIYGGAGMKEIVKKLIIAAVIIGALAYGLRFWRSYNPIPKQVKASGTIEVQEVQLAPQASGRLVYLNVEEAKHVHKGELLAKMSLDGADDQLASAKSALAAAEAQLSELRNGFRREQIAAAKASAAASRVQYEQALRDQKRFEKLAHEGAVPARQAEIAAENSNARREAAKAAEEQYKLLANGNRAEDIAAALANVNRMKAEVARAKVGVGYKEFYSPVDGVILTKNYELGDVVMAGAPIATLGKTGDMWVKLYIPATQLGLVKLNATADVKIDAYKDRVFKGRVTMINQKAEYNPRLSLSQDERANMVFWVKVSVKDSDGILKPGMPADVTINKD